MDEDLGTAGLDQERADSLNVRLGRISWVLKFPFVRIVVFDGRVFNRKCD